jgi:tryptophan synthase alpha chain
MSGISKTFKTLKERKEGALVGYIMAGDPNPKLTPKIADALIRGGVDILELGLPFSDPIADGPTIQAASLRALNAGTKPKAVLGIAKKIKDKRDVPVIVMTYYNPVFKMGLQEFFCAAKANFVDGVIVPDLPIEEAGDYQKAAESQDIDTVFLAAPSTSNERLSKIVECSSGFLYLVSHFGVTGTKNAVDDSTLSLVKRVTPFTTGRIPLAVGFGVSKPEHVKSLIKAGADGVIVGSAFVDIIAKNTGNAAKMCTDIEEAARKLKEATIH